MYAIFCLTENCTKLKAHYDIRDKEPILMSYSPWDPGPVHWCDTPVSTELSWRAAPQLDISSSSARQSGLASTSVCCTLTFVKRLPSTVYRLQSTVYSLPCTVYSLPSTVYRLQSTVYSLPSTVYRLQSNVYSLQSTVYSLPYTIYRIQSTVYSISQIDRRGVTDSIRLHVKSTCKQNEQ